MENYICVHLFQPEMATFGNPYWKWFRITLESEKRQFSHLFSMGVLQWKSVEMWTSRDSPYTQLAPTRLTSHPPFSSIIDMFWEASVGLMKAMLFGKLETLFWRLKELLWVLWSTIVFTSWIFLQTGNYQPFEGINMWDGFGCHSGSNRSRSNYEIHVSLRLRLFNETSELLSSYPLCCILEIHS